jgi:hypothetical protein
MTMFESNQQQFIANRVRIMRIIVLAMAAGIVLFLTVILTVSELARPLMPERQARLLTYIAAAYGGVALAAAPLISTLLMSAGMRQMAQSPPSKPKAATLPSPPEFLQSDAGKLTALYATKTIISAAFYEGAALFLCVAYLLGRNPAATAIAAILLAALLWQLPTADRVQRWLESRLRQLEQDRQSGKP